MALNIDQLVKRYNAEHPERRRITELQARDAGRFIPLELGDVRIDGRTKSAVLSGWVSTIRGFWAGFLGSNDVQYAPLDENQTAALEALQQLYKERDLHQADSYHIGNSVLCGRSVEIVTMIGSDLFVEVTDPAAWSFVRNEDGELRVALMQCIVPAGTLYNNELLTKDLVTYWVYDDTNVSVYEVRAKDTVLREATPHPFGTPPVVVYQADRDGMGLFTRALLSQVDSFDIMTSAVVDSVRFGVDSFLAVSGMTPKSLLEQEVVARYDNVIYDQHGHAIGTTGEQTEIRKGALEVVKEAGILCLPDPTSKAEFVNKAPNIDSVRFALGLAWNMICQQSGLPDLGSNQLDASSAILSISGPALRLRFQGALHKSSEMIRHLEVGFGRRLALFNRAQEVLGKPQLAADIAINPAMPQDTQEALALVSALRSLIPLRDLLGLIPQISNADELAARAQAEKPAQSPTPPAQ